MIKKIPFIIVVVVLFSSCRKSVSEIPAILIDISHDSEAYLSEIAEEVDMVKLETTENSLIKEIRDVEILNDHYFIYHDVYSEVLMFDLNGQFIKKVGQIGRGPGEYIALTQIVVDNENRRLLINTRGIMIFDHNGIFVEHIKLEKGSPTSMLVRDKQLYCFHNAFEWLNSGKRESSSFLTTNNTTDWKLIDSIYFKSYTGNFIFPAFLTISNQNIYLYSSIPVEPPETKSDVDTLYVLKNNNAIPYLTAQVVGKGKNGGGVVNKIEMADSYGIITHTVFVKDAEARRSRAEYSQYYFNSHTTKGKNATNGFIDDFHSGKNVIITPIPNTNKFFYYTTDYSDLETVPNPILYIGTFKK